MAKHDVLLLAFDGFEMLDIVGPMEVFAGATAMLAKSGGRSGYAITVAAEAAGPVRAASGAQLVADCGYGQIGENYDTVVMAGGPGVHGRNHRALEETLRRLAPPAVRRLGSVCTGAFILANTGMLEGRRATTHWAHAERFAVAYPNVDLQPDAIFIKDGGIFTSAGITAGMDLALALVEEDFGRDLALAVARDLVMFLKRPGGQAQFSVPLRMQFRNPSDPRLSRVEEHIRTNLAGDLGVPSLALVAGMSPRNFARVFVSAHGVSPARFVELARMEAARQMLEETNHPLAVVAGQVGFASEAVMRRCFLRRLGVTPSGYRSRFRTSASTTTRDNNHRL